MNLYIVQINLLEHMIMIHEQMLDSACNYLQMTCMYQINLDIVSKCKELNRGRLNLRFIFCQNDIKKMIICPFVRSLVSKFEYFS